MAGKPLKPSKSHQLLSMEGLEASEAFQGRWERFGISGSHVWADDMGGNSPPNIDRHSHKQHVT